MNDEQIKEDVNESEVVTPNVSQETETQESPSPVDNSKEFNFRKMEEKNDRLARELLELQDLVKKESESKVSEVPIDELSELQDDDLITMGQANKLSDQRAKKIVKEELAKLEKGQLPEKAKAKFKDFDQVVTQENIELLIKEDPDLDHDIQLAKDPFSRIYKEIRKSDFYRLKSESNETKGVIEKNMSKPVSGNSLGNKSPLRIANAYSKGDKTLLAEMSKYRGGSI